MNISQFPSLRFHLPRGARLKLALATLLLAGFTASAQANLITNGSFEFPVLPSNLASQTVKVGSTAIPGWSVVGPAGKSVDLVGPHAGSNFAASDGLQWIDLTGNGANASEGLSQTVATTPGAYQLTFDVGNVNWGGPYGIKSTVDLWINGTRAQSFSNSAGGGAINWASFTYSFLATGPTTVGFRNADPSNDNENGLDNVVLTAVSKAIPEPSTSSLMLVGTLALASLARQRRKCRS